MTKTKNTKSVRKHKHVGKAPCASYECKLARKKAKAEGRLGFLRRSLKSENALSKL